MGHEEVICEVEDSDEENGDTSMECEEVIIVFHSSDNVYLDF